MSRAALVDESLQESQGRTMREGRSFHLSDVRIFRETTVAKCGATVRRMRQGVDVLPRFLRDVRRHPSLRGNKMKDNLIVLIDRQVTIGHVQ